MSSIKRPAKRHWVSISTNLIYTIKKTVGLNVSKPNLHYKKAMGLNVNKPNLHYKKAVGLDLNKPNLHYK
jgi:hypothetical protein